MCLSSLGNFGSTTRGPFVVSSPWNSSQPTRLEGSSTTWIVKTL